ncbi:MAG: Wzz/FepE/Etk N-terminal domain-containing protein [Rhizobiaceae bacterium]|nr:Wzz/FepE/Etk N-terminal domain-containing protein [Rhizobiaceae bacterium]
MQGFKRADWANGLMGDIDLKFYASLLLRRLPILVGAAAVCTVLAVAVALLIPKTYEASARLVVEAPQIPAEMVRTTAPTNAVEQLQIIEQEIMTRDTLLGLAKRHGVYDAYLKVDENDIVDDMSSRLRFKQLELDSARDSAATVFSISFRSKSPVQAADVVNDVVSLVLERNVRLRTERAADTQRFFNQEVDRLSRELAGLDKQILEFKNANKDALPDSLDFRHNQQSSQQERLAMLEREEASLRSRRENLVQIFQQTGRVATGPVSPEQQLLDDLNRALSEQLSIFSEDSPNVMSLRKRIADLQKSLKEKSEKGEGKKGMSELDLQLADVDERLQFLTNEKASIRKNLEHLAETIAATPTNETALNSLVRARDNTQLQYNTAVAKLAEASAGEQIELHAKGGRLAVVERAVPPVDAVSPRRKLITALGLVGGGGLGFAFIVLMELLNRTVRRPSELAAIIPGQPFVTLPYIPQPGEQVLSDFWQGWHNAQQFLRTLSARLPWPATDSAGLESR